MNLAEIQLSTPNIGHEELANVSRALMQSEVTAGAFIQEFEEEIQAASNRDFAVCVSSGTAALHLGLIALGIGRGDKVIVPTLTFAATAFACEYVGVEVILVDVDPQTLCIDLELTNSILEQDKNREIKCIISVDLYGRTPNYDALEEISSRHGVYLFCDSAESLGSINREKKAGESGTAAVFSFNGNKIITSAGGGAFVTNDLDLAKKVRHLANQAKENEIWYEHLEVGFNYRMSNISAAIGVAQIKKLSEFVSAKRAIQNRYSSSLTQAGSFGIVQDCSFEISNAWLSLLFLNAKKYPEGALKFIRSLNSNGIMARPIWKPLHLQPVFRNSQKVITGAAESFFQSGICLPSGSNLSLRDQNKVIKEVNTLLNVRDDK